MGYLLRSLRLLYLLPIYLTTITIHLQADETIPLASRVDKTVPTDLHHHKRRSVIVDTDGTVEGMIAILYLINHPAIDLKAITTVGTWEQCEYYLTRLLKRTEITTAIPIATGISPSLSPINLSERWLKESLLIHQLFADREQMTPLNQPDLDIQEWTAPAISSVELMSQVLATASTQERVIILCTGPLTNLAQVLTQHPEFLERIEEVYIVGGAITAPGDITEKLHGIYNRFAEHNIYLDAAAAFSVIRSSLPITLIPLETMKRAPIEWKSYVQWGNNQAASPSAQFVYEAIDLGTKLYPQQKHYFRSTLAALMITGEYIGTYRKMNCIVNLGMGHSYGRILMTRQGYPLKIALLDHSPDICSYLFTRL